MTTKTNKQTNAERLKEIRQLRSQHKASSGGVWTYKEGLVDELYEIAREEMERANRRGELLKEIHFSMKHLGLCLNSDCPKCSDIRTRIQKEIQ